MPWNCNCEEAADGKVLPTEALWVRIATSILATFELGEIGDAP